MQYQAIYNTNLSAKNYHPFGMTMPGRSFTSENYRFGFNGMEKADDIASGNYTTPFREIDTRLGGRWWSQDPIVKPWESPYAGFSNNPIVFSDPSGLNSQNETGGDDGKCTDCGMDSGRGSGETPEEVGEVELTVNKEAYLKRAEMNESFNAQNDVKETDYYSTYDNWVKDTPGATGNQKYDKMYYDANIKHLAKETNAKNAEILRNHEMMQKLGFFTRYFWTIEDAAIAYLNYQMIANPLGGWATPKQFSYMPRINIATEEVVYGYVGICQETGLIKYVGIGNKPPLRWASHSLATDGKQYLNYSTSGKFSSRLSARIWEQRRINTYGLGGKAHQNGQLFNRINSIAEKNWHKYGIKK